MAWEWLLLLLTVQPTEVDGYDEAWAAVGYTLGVRHLEMERPTFATYSSAWNERVRQEYARQAGPPRPRGENP